ncbi:MAG TPA: hypothetical protein DEA43_02665 [Candidatus Moranbacteria bacterium]|nr:hypothetical protein [Candidatus Moranbacteria bacterium]HBT45766.1 hypothetical protein [Candidatus Moranbacteria bacterium]
MKKKYNKIKQGFSLVEVLISLLVLSIGISSVLFLMTANTKNSINAKNQIIASGLAQEGIELVRNLKDNNPATFTTDITTQNDYRIDYTFSYDAFRNSNNASNAQKQLFLNGNGFYSHSNGVGAISTKFYRKISVSIATVSLKKVATITSYVSWNDSGIPAVCNVANKCVSVVAVLPDL